MKKSHTHAAVAASLFAASAAIASPVTMDWSTVGNAGNAADPNGPGGPSGIGFGSVGYEYRIGTYEVTNSQYASFLNSVAASDPNGLYNTRMGSTTLGGITRSGSAGSFTYSVKANMGNKPVNSVSHYDAARMANWMTNGQGSGGTESGAYTFDGPTSISAITRDQSNPNQVFLPTEDEWYKAAYHQPASEGGDGDDYWLYATRSNSVPTAASATSTGDVANPGQDVANVDRSANWNGTDQTPFGPIGNVTTVGSAESTSFYGAFDMAGNVREWNETTSDLSASTPGGSFIGPGSNSRSLIRSFFGPFSEDDATGFRFASNIPAPGSVALVAIGAPLLVGRRRR